MPMTTLTSREFNQDPAGARKAAVKGPIVITYRGAPAHVLLTYDRYLALSGGSDVVEFLGMVEGAEIDFDPPRVSITPKSACW